MGRSLFSTTDSFSPTVARVALGLIILPHGGQHLLGWFGGYGFTGTLGWMTGDLGFPAPLAATALVLEFVAPLLLITGLGGRPAALAIIGIMLGALSTHYSDGFFMNWFGKLEAGKEGFEYHLLAIALAAVVAISGSGRWSVDRVIAES